jgi:hypothetical protein
MKKISGRSETPKQHPRLSLLRASVLVTALALTLGVIPVGATGAASMMVDRAGARFMSYRALIEDPKKFDRRPVWVTGGLISKNGITSLGELNGKSAFEAVCVRPTESFSDPAGSMGSEILARFDGLDPISVHGRYESAPSSQCPNGTIFAALLEVSLE